MTVGARGAAILPTPAHFVAAVRFVIAAQFACLVSALTYVLAFDLRIVAPPGCASRRNQKGERGRGEYRYSAFGAHSIRALRLQIDRARGTDDRLGSVGLVTPDF